MNYALIFAGGTGQRMNTKTRPKQFLELYGKPIILYTIEAFENHPAIDGIVVVCLEDWSLVVLRGRNLSATAWLRWKWRWGATMRCSSTMECVLW